MRKQLAYCLRNLRIWYDWWHLYYLSIPFHHFPLKPSSSANNHCKNWLWLFFCEFCLFSLVAPAGHF